MANRTQNPEDLLFRMEAGGPWLLIIKYRGPVSDTWVVPMSSVRPDDLEILKRVNARSDGDSPEDLPYEWTDTFLDLCDAWAEFFVGTCGTWDSKIYRCYAHIEAVYTYIETVPGTDAEDVEGVDD